MKNPRTLVLLTLVAGLSSCTVTSREYVEDLAGYSVTEGRIIRISNLQSESLESLEDGLAITLNRPGCQVWIEFDSGESKLFKLDPGVILVHGYESDFILRSTLGNTGAWSSGVPDPGVPTNPVRTTPVPTTSPTIDLPGLPPPTSGPSGPGRDKNL